MKTYKDVITKGMIMIGLVVLIGAVLLYPLYLDIVSVDEKIHQTKVELDQQRIYAPEYSLFQERSEVGFEAQFAAPKAAPIEVRDLGEAAKNVAQFAEQAGLKVEDVVISPSSLREGDGKLMMQAMTMGELDAFMQFYTSLGAWGALYRVNMVEMQAIQGGHEFYVEFWVHIAGGAG